MDLRGDDPLVPPPRVHRHRYHGVLAPNSPLRAQAEVLLCRCLQTITGDIHYVRSWPGAAVRLAFEPGVRKLYTTFEAVAPGMSAPGREPPFAGLRPMVRFRGKADCLSPPPSVPTVRDRSRTADEAPLRQQFLFADNLGEPGCLQAVGN